MVLGLGLQHWVKVTLTFRVGLGLGLELGFELVLGLG